MEERDGLASREAIMPAVRGGEWRRELMAGSDISESAMKAALLQILLIFPPSFLRSLPQL